MPPSDPQSEQTIEKVIAEILELEAKADEAKARIRAVADPLSRTEEDWERDGGAIVALEDALRNNCKRLCAAASRAKRMEEALREQVEWYDTKITEYHPDDWASDVFTRTHGPRMERSRQALKEP